MGGDAELLNDEDEAFLSLPFQTFLLGINLDLQKSCKGSEKESPQVLYMQFPRLLTSYT